MPKPGKPSGAQLSERARKAEEAHAARRLAALVRAGQQGRPAAKA